MNKARRDPRFLRSLQYFEAVARYGSMQGAAQELGVSPSAVSHQLREMTRAIGEELFVRKGRGIALTEAGEALAATLSSAFSALDSTFRTLLGDERTRLRIAVCSAFGPHWLAPRLSGFMAANPEVDAELRLYAEDPEQTQSVADCMVTARPVKLGFSGTELFEEHLVAVGMGNGESPLITTDSEPGAECEDWRRYAANAGLDFDVVARAGVVKCTHYVLAMALARAGSGVALVPDFLADEALREGKLRQIFPQPHSSGRVYRLCVKEARAGEMPIRRLSAWLRRETRALRNDG